MAKAEAEPAAAPPHAPARIPGRRRARLGAFLTAAASVSILGLTALGVAQSLEAPDPGSDAAPPVSAAPAIPVASGDPVADQAGGPDTAPAGPREQEPVAVPELIGLSLAEATALLEELGLRLGEVESAHGTDPQGTVLAGSRRAGAAVEPGSTVSLTVASGLNLVPDVIGMRGDEARVVLEAAGFLTESTSEDGTMGGDGSEHDTIDWSGTVHASTPRPGSPLALGSAVMLTLEPPIAPGGDADPGTPGQEWSRPVTGP